MSRPNISGWLLDTHALLWMLHDDPRLSPEAANAMNGDLPVWHSVVSFWEIAIKAGGKGFDFEVCEDWEVVFPRELKRIEVPMLEIGPRDCRMVQDLPLHHRDPFDRMLACQALRRGLGIISRDGLFDSYDVSRAW